VENSPDIIYILDPQGRFTFVGGAVESLLGFKPEELQGKHFGSIVWREDAEKADWHFNERRTGERATRGVDVRLGTKRGQERHFEIKCLPFELYAMGVYDKPASAGDKTFLGTYGVARDATDRKRAEEELLERTRQLETAYEQVRLYARDLKEEIGERKRIEAALRESEAKYVGLVENSLTGIYIDQDGKIVFANRRFAEIYGYAKEDLTGMESWQLVHPDDRELTNGMRMRRIRGEEALSEYVARGLTKSGDTIWVARRNTRIEYRGGPAILGNIVDVTKQKRAEEKLRDSQERYYTVLEACPDSVIVYDMEGKSVYINPAFTKVFGWTPGELLGMKTRYVPEENWPETKIMIDKVKTGESFSGIESRRYLRGGEIIDVSISAASYLNREGIPEGSVHILRDITDRKRAEGALQKAHDAISKAHDVGIEPYTSFLIGNDGDDPGTADRMLEFAQRSGIRKAEFAIFTPYPGTPSWQSMVEQDRIISTEWARYNDANVVFRPARMEPDELTDAYLYLWREFYRSRAHLADLPIAERTIQF
jgi:PAS domain S-box-containing protein